MLLFLVGMPASGKTYWLKSFAKALHLEAIDLDNFIETQQNCSISALFQKGELNFRKAEQEALLTLINSSKQTIIATGGGTPCHYDNLNNMKKNGLVVYLQTSIDQLMYRLTNDNTSRPLMPHEKSIDIKQNLTTIFAARKSFYEQADIIFHTGKDDFQDIIQQIKITQPCLNQH